MATVGSMLVLSCIEKHVIKNQIDLKHYAGKIEYFKEIYNLNSQKYKDLFIEMCKYSCFGFGGGGGIIGAKEFMKMNNLTEEDNSKVIAKLFKLEIDNYK